MADADNRLHGFVGAKPEALTCMLILEQAVGHQNHMTLDYLDSCLFVPALLTFVSVKKISP